MQAHTTHTLPSARAPFHPGHNCCFCCFHSSRASTASSFNNQKNNTNLQLVVCLVSMHLLKHKKRFVHKNFIAMFDTYLTVSRNVVFSPTIQYHNSFNYFWSKLLHWQGLLTELTLYGTVVVFFCRCVTPTNLTLSFSIHTKKSGINHTYIHVHTYMCRKK